MSFNRSALLLVFTMINITSEPILLLGKRNGKSSVNKTHSVSGQILIQDFGRVGQLCHLSFYPPPLLYVPVDEVI